MSETTNIQWCDETVNPVMGCSGCELAVPRSSNPPVCYAARLHEQKAPYNKGYAPDFFLPTLYPGRTTQAARHADLTGTPRPDKPWLNGLPRLIFVSDMGDALSDRPFGSRLADGRHVFGSDGFYAIGDFDGLELHLKEAPKNQADRRWRRDNEHLDASAGVDGIEAFYEQCVANGPTIVTPLAATAWGKRDFYIEDPDGYIICFGGRPASG